jgi:hypothetical protein
MSGFITAVDTNSFNGVVGGRLVTAATGLLPQPAVRRRRGRLQLHRYQLQRAPGFAEPLRQRFMFQTNYTFGKSIDDISDDTNGAGTGLLLPKDSITAAWTGAV